MRKTSLTETICYVIGIVLWSFIWFPIQLLIEEKAEENWFYGFIPMFMLAFFLGLHQSDTFYTDSKKVKEQNSILYPVMQMGIIAGIFASAFGMGIVANFSGD